MQALSFKRSLCTLVLCVCVLTIHAQAQQNQPPAQTDEDVLRIKSDLIQTDVMVFDKQGRFVENLKREQFELRIGGKPQPISFFERVTAGSFDEEAQLRAARADANASSSSAKVVPLDRGRTVIFFVDDLHLSAENYKRIRDLLLGFIAREVGQNDEAVITSSSGQIGFLQQPTGDKAVLRAAVERIRPRNSLTRDFDRPPMTELHALAIENNNQDVTDYFVEAVLRDNPGMLREMAVGIVTGRARAITQNAASVTNNMLVTLASLVKSAAEMPGRKLLFFISEGFLLNDRTADVSYTIHKITDAAARSGVVIYAIDSRGLSTPNEDASVTGMVDPTNRLLGAGLGDTITKTQEPLRTLAASTGGRAMLNTNALSSIVTEALKETSVYYLLAWQPLAETSRDERFRKIEVSVVGRPELVVRVRSGFLTAAQKETAQNSSGKKSGDADKNRKPKKSVEDELLVAVKNLLPLTALPTSLFASYVDTEQDGIALTVSMEMDGAALSFEPAGGEREAKVDVAGIIYNDQGKSVSGFSTNLTVKAPTGGQDWPKEGIAYNYQTQIKPGLYQVRVAARDSKTGRTGSAMQWIEIPDLSAHRLSLSSLMIGENKAPAASAGQPDAAQDQTILLSIARRFTRTSRLRFLTQIYNAAHATTGDGAPDVALQVQIFRDNQPVLTTELNRVNTLGLTDLTRLPYAAEIPLNSMPPGRYLLQVTVIDRIAKSSATQSVQFVIS